MDTIQITCTLKDVPSFLGVYPSDKLPGIVHRTGTVIVNADLHTKEGSHWLAIHLEPRLSCAYYFDSYGRPPNDHNILSFIRRNAAIWGYNSIPLQGPSRLSVVSTLVYTLAIWTRDFRHPSSPRCFLLTAEQISRQKKCFASTLDLSAECHVEGSVASRPSYSKYILLSHHTLSYCLPMEYSREDFWRDCLFMILHFI